MVGKHYTAVDAARAHKVDSVREGHHKQSLEVERNFAMKAAKELHYSRTVIAKLMVAETFGQIEQIMATARKRSLE